MVSIIIPAKNESKGLAIILPDIRLIYPDAEIIVVDDGSTDDTAAVAASYGALVYSSPYSKGNGAAIKAGLRVASKDVIICMDADGQHSPEEIPLLITKLEKGYDMVVGARNHQGQANLHRSFANRFYNWFGGWMVGQKIDDLTSGFRAVKRNRFLEFINLLPNKFSYPTTITMSFFRVGYSVGYVPINVKKRVEGTFSHINIWRDGIRFLLIIFKIATLYSPLKLFLPISFAFFSSGFLYYIFTYVTDHRFTNMSALLLSTSVVVFLMGLISEQITMLIYSKNDF